MKTSAIFFSLRTVPTGPPTTVPKFVVADNDVGDFFLPVAAATTKAVTLSLPTSLADHIVVVSAATLKKLGRPCAKPGTAGDTQRNTNRRSTYGAGKQEKKILEKYKAAVAQSDLKLADHIFHAELLPTATGKRLFPQSSRAHVALHVVENIGKLNRSLGPKSKHRADLLLHVTAGIPAAFCESALGVDPAFLRQAKLRAQNAPRASALETEGRHEDGRECAPAAMDEELVKFFLSRTHIDSGASTQTRQLTMTQERLFAELHAEMPALVRRAVHADPSLRAFDNAPVLTRLHMNVWAAEAAAAVDGFLEASEYTARLRAELQR